MVELVQHLFLPLSDNLSWVFTRMNWLRFNTTASNAVAEGEIQAVRRMDASGE